MSKNRKFGWVCISLAYIVVALGVGYAVGIAQNNEIIISGREGIAAFYREQAGNAKEQGADDLASILFTLAGVIEMGDEERFSYLTRQYSEVVRVEIKNRKLLQKKLKEEKP